MLVRGEVHLPRLEGHFELFEEAAHDERARAGRVVEGVHGRQKSYMRPGLRMPAGSNASFRRRWIFMSAAGSGWNTPIALSPPRKSVAWPPRRSAVERMFIGSRSPLTHPSPPPPSPTCPSPVVMTAPVSAPHTPHTIRS